MLNHCQNHIFFTHNSQNFNFLAKIIRILFGYYSQNVYLCSGFHSKLRGKDTKKAAEKRILTVKNKNYVTK